LPRNFLSSLSDVHEMAYRYKGFSDIKIRAAGIEKLGCAVYDRFSGILKGK